jgi:hypothetical protein
MAKALQRILENRSWDDQLLADDLLREVRFGIAHGRDRLRSEDARRATARALAAADELLAKHKNVDNNTVGGKR